MRLPTSSGHRRSGFSAVMKAVESLPSGAGLVKSRLRMRKGAPPATSIRQSSLSWPLATTRVPLSKTKTVPGVGQAKSMVWAWAEPAKSTAAARAKTRRSIMPDDTEITRNGTRRCQPPRWWQDYITATRPALARQPYVRPAVGQVIGIVGVVLYLGAGDGDRFEFDQRQVRRLARDDLLELDHHLLALGGIGLDLDLVDHGVDFRIGIA